MNPTLRALNGFGLGARPGERRRVDRRARLAARAAARRRAAVCARRPKARRAPLPMPSARSARSARATIRRDERRASRRGARSSALRRPKAAPRSPSASRPNGRSSSGSSRSGRIISACRSARRSSSRRSPAATSAKPSGRMCSAGSKTWCSRRRSIRRCSSTSTTSNRSGRRLAGPRSAAAAQGQRRGLNENYARELLELHTLGVDGGYTQQDVQELAKILTGWTVGGLGRGAGQQTAPAARGAESMAGQPRSTDASASRFRSCCTSRERKPCSARDTAKPASKKASASIRALARHPSTARFVATKLVTHFVSDEPPAAAVDRIARVFRDTDGDLARRVRRADRSARGVERRRAEVPHAAGLAGRRAARVRRDRGQRHGDAAAAAAAASALVAAGAKGIRRHDAGMGRSRFAAESRRARAHDRAPACARSASIRAILLDVVDVPPGDPLHTLLADSSIAADERIALALAGPAFQWR